LRGSEQPDQRPDGGTDRTLVTLGAVAEGAGGRENGGRPHMVPERGDLLKTIAAMLAAGLKTEVEPFPETDKEFGDILLKLRQLPPEDLEGKLVVSGFVDRPYGPDKQRCMECMYYLVHRKWCDLPELAVPVGPEWWCRLWRI
jgi:hypothetical protein